MAEAVCRPTLTTCGICGGRKWHWDTLLFDYFCFCLCVSFHQYCTRIHLPPAPYNGSIWQRCQIKHSKIKEMLAWRERVHWTNPSHNTVAGSWKDGTAILVCNMSSRFMIGPATWPLASQEELCCMKLAGYYWGKYLKRQRNNKTNAHWNVEEATKNREVNQSPAQMRNFTSGRHHLRAIKIYNYFISGTTAQRGAKAASFFKFLDNTQWHITAGGMSMPPHWTF